MDMSGVTSRKDKYSDKRLRMLDRDIIMTERTFALEIVN